MSQDLSAPLSRLRGLLEQVGEKWKAECISDEGKVIGRFGPLFAPDAVHNLKEEDLRAFLSIKDNLHWHGLQLFSKPIFEDMNRLRNALEILVDEKRDIKERLNKLIPKGDNPMVPNLGRARLTAVLHVVYPKKYGVLNNATEEAMREVGAWPDFPQGASFGDCYEIVNDILLELSRGLNIDLWSLDVLWARLKPPPGDDSHETSLEGLEESPGEEVGEGRQSFILEKYLQQFLSDNWDHLDLSKEWAVYVKDGEPVGFEFDTKEIGRIDLLAKHRRGPKWLVIELKRGQPGDAVLGQVQRYMGWVKKNKANADEVRGLVICRKVDQKLAYALAYSKNVDAYEYEIDFKLRRFV